MRGDQRRAGVSHNAPYRHFRDRDELMSAVAAQGFRELTEAMVGAAARQSDPLDRLKRAGLGYVTLPCADPNTSRSCLTHRDPSASIRMPQRQRNKLSALFWISSKVVRTPGGCHPELHINLPCWRGPWSTVSPTWPSPAACLFPQAAMF